MLYIVDGNKKIKIIDIALFFDIFYRPDLFAIGAFIKDISELASPLDLEKLLKERSINIFLELVSVKNNSYL